MIEWIILVLGLISYYLYFWKIHAIKTFKATNNLRNKSNLTQRTKDLPPVYPNGWFALLHSCELGKGQVKYISALGEHFAVFRTESGIVNIINAYCPHLGANLGIGGKVKGDCLECPFHSWTFNGDGQCQSIPYSSRALSGIKTKNWICREVNKEIFIWYHAESMDPYWEIEAIPEIDNGKWIYQGQNEYFVNCHIQEIPENGSDWTHLDAVHVPAMFCENLSPSILHHSWTGSGWCPPESIDVDQDHKYSENDKVKINSGIQNGNTTKMNLKSIENSLGNTEKIEIEDRRKIPVKNQKHLATFHLIHNIKLFNKFSFLRLEVNGVQIGPGYVLMNIKTSFGPICILQTVTPVEPLLQRVTHLVYSPFFNSPLTKIVFYGMENMFERDVLVWDHKIYLKNPILVKEERRIATFRRWYSQFYSTNSPTHKSLTSLDW
ncbi:cholesterol 7-desaturase-like [Chelonus insularis]|uniref:cholesterol 7-desaturase-like n=1 Tax=Chelonus insularis TaxID=460826 RepID=UPI001588CF53|nr:cholesterol 7-desaturase-like [Chelonus insularis]